MRGKYVFAAMVLWGATPAMAQQGAPAQGRGEAVVDAVTQPLDDLNVRKDDIPDKLLAIESDPYSLAGMDDCAAIEAEIYALDDVLGGDVDATEERKKSLDKKLLGFAGNVLGGLIPFRGLVREVSGANKHKARMADAIYAGTSRRSFLKGVGAARGCTGGAVPTPVALRANSIAAYEAETKAYKKETNTIEDQTKAINERRQRADDQRKKAEQAREKAEKERRKAEKERAKAEKAARKAAERAKR